MSPSDPESNLNSSQEIAYEPPEEDRPSSATPTETDLEANIPTVQRLDGSPQPMEHDPYAALRLPVYRLFMGNYALAVIGSGVMTVAIRWELAKSTNDPLVLGWLGGISALPVVLLSLLAGHASDRFSRKRVLMVTQTLLVACPILLALLVGYDRGGPHYIALTYAIILLNAIALAFARPARQSILPQLVPSEIFSNAVTWNASFFETASITGPAIGGLIIARFSVMGALIFSAVCTSICFFLTALLPSVPAVNRGETMNMKSLVAGVRFVFSKRLMLAVMTMDLFAVLLGGAVYMLPLFATQILHVGSFGFGLLQAAPSIGAVSMALFLAHRPPMQHAGRSLLLAVAGFGFATIVFGISHWFWLSLAMLCLTGAFDNISVVVRHTLVQLLTPDQMRGRVSAVNMVFIGSSNEIGGFESGLTAKWLGLARSVVLGGIGTIVVVASVAGIWPQIRRFGALQSANPDTE
jgi:MFS family permease